MFTGVPVRDRDPAKALHVQEVATPEVGPDEVLVAVLASGINYNTVWTSIFEPMPTFGFLRRYGKTVPGAAKHDQPFHVVGSDMAGVVLRTGAAVRNVRPGDRVVAHCLNVELTAPDGHDDSMLDPEQRIWGFETNYGGLGDLALVKANQLMPKPRHLTWEEAAASGLVHSTAYRQLVSPNGACMRQGNVVLIWGAAGGLGSYATQLVLNGGGIPVCVVSSPEKADLVRSMGASLVIDRAAEGFRFWTDENTQDQREWRRFGARIRDLTGGDDPDIVFEHPGRETFGASVYTARRGGTIVTCASTSGYEHSYDNRHLWMRLKRIIGTHFANYREAWEANRLIAKAMVHPTLSMVYGLEQTSDAVREVHANRHNGKVGVLCLAPAEGLGVEDTALREEHLPRINHFRAVSA
ncbi:crotonyl-CoA reductase [Actinoplanes sp. NBRC 14428]|nr:crotonyl-CoA reductase [Actinoplanes sp. NBRC 14428]